MKRYKSKFEEKLLDIKRIQGIDSLKDTKIYINPKSVNGFPKGVRGVLDKKGNIYLWDNLNVIHTDELVLPNDTLVRIGYDNKLNSDYFIVKSSRPIKDYQNLADKKDTKINQVFKEDAEEDKSLEAIKDLIDTKWSGSNEEQGKAVALLKGLAFSDTDVSNKFMKELDTFTSGLKIEDFE